MLSVSQAYLILHGWYREDEGWENAGKLPTLTGAMVKLAVIAAKGTFENVRVCVAVVFVTWINAVA